ncbi:MAG TPA: hypothetical protein PKV72_03660 [Candidatus Peribacteria bacterium]|nr:hypothetical protein [Candidatus Peribacteria bacterium]
MIEDDCKRNATAAPRHEAHALSRKICGPLADDDTWRMRPYPTYDHLEEVAEDEIGTPTPEEWDMDPAAMGNVVGGVIAGRLQEEGLRLYGGEDAEEAEIQIGIRTAVLVAIERHTHLTPADSLLCSDSVIRYLSEPPFNQPDPHEHRRAA